MNKLVLSRRADKDIADIADYTIGQFGIKQARLYRNGLEELFQTLLEYPQQGRAAAELAPKLRRIPCRVLPPYPKQNPHCADPPSKHGRTKTPVMCYRCFQGKNVFRIGETINRYLFASPSTF